MENSIVHFEIMADGVACAGRLRGRFRLQDPALRDARRGPAAGEPCALVETVEVDASQPPISSGAIDGGLMKRPQPDRPIMNYLGIDSTDAILENIAASGGRILLPKTGIAPAWIASRCSATPGTA